jgi:hypothetical protein
MQKITLSILLTLLLSSCNGWIIQPLPGPTPFLPSTPTPSIFTPTPVVIGVTSASATPGIATPTATTIIPTNTETSLPAPTLTSSPIGPAISIKVLGCNTSIDITHSMGEVTNAFVTIKNTGGMELTNIKVTLFALDEGREHPDKTVELTSLPVGYQVTMKLTVDSTYKQESAIQVEVITNQGTFPREGSASCTDIGVFAPNPDALNTPMPNVP